MNTLPFATWSYPEQTKIKHKVFTEYFDKWVKILGRYHKFNYIDCFAGAGAYEDNGKIYYGSPILAAKIIKTNKKTATIVVIDDDKKNLENLETIFEFEKLTDLTIIPVNQDFDKTINKILEQKQNLAPTFFFIDPWGFKISYATLKRIMKVEKSEILLNFQFNALDRFLSWSSLENTITDLFGTDEWKFLTKFKGLERENSILNLYREKLEQIADFVFPFKVQFPHRDRTYYYLFHLTNYWLGCSIMKSCFAQHAHGRLEYLGDRSSQLRLFEIGSAKTDEIKQLLLEKYNGQIKSYLDIMKDNISKTKFLESEIKNGLKQLESKGVAFIDRNPKTTEKTPRLRSSIEENDLFHFNNPPSILRKTLLYKTKVEYGNFTINHVLGCAHGCHYPCYARMLAIKYGQIKDYEDWMHPRIVSNALELLDKEIRKYKQEIDFVHLSFTTDPFMYDLLNKRIYRHIKDLTLEIIEKLNKNGVKCTILTKGIYPKILATNKKFSKENEYGITLVSLDKKFKKEYEPYSPPFEDRLKALKFLHDKGLKTWVSIEPYPTPNIVKQNLDLILKSVSFVDKIIFGKMNYNVTSNKFENNREFYKEHAVKVIEFCKKNKIKYHIKEGTPYSCNKTKEIFKEGS